MMTTLIALFILFAIPFGVFVGLYEDSHDKIWAYVAARALLLAFYVLAKVSFHFICPSPLNRER